MSQRLVLDASAGLAAVAGGADGRALLQPIEAAEVVVAPDIYAAEVANGLWKYVGAGDLSADEAQARLLKALELVDLTLPSAELVSEALLEAGRMRHPIYDLLYAVVARRIGGAVLTRDRRLRSMLDRLAIPTA
jgi:predicted nucleic acid-binding protein